MPDSTANYLTTDANGNVSAEFSGFVYANGLALVAADTPALYDSNHSILWTKDTKTGAVVAYIKGSAVPPNGDPASVEVGVVSPTNGRNAYIRPTVVDNPGNANDDSNQVQVGVVGFNSSTKMLLNARGKSNFAQLSTAGRSMTTRRTLTWPGGAGAVVASVQPAWGYGNNENKYYALAQQRFIAGANDMGGPVLIIVENWIPNDGVVLRVSTPLGTTPAAGTTSTVDIMIWEGP